MSLCRAGPPTELQQSAVEQKAPNVRWPRWAPVINHKHNDVTRRQERHRQTSGRTYARPLLYGFPLWRDDMSKIPNFQFGVSMPPNSGAMLSIAHAPEFQNSGAMCCHKLAMPPNSEAQSPICYTPEFMASELRLGWIQFVRWRC